LAFFVFSRFSSSSESVELSFCSSSVFCVCCILFCISCILSRSVFSRVSRIIGGSSPSFMIMTFFSHFAHQRSPFFSLKSGDAHAGQARSVSVEPCLSRSAIFLMCSSSGFCFDKFYSLCVE
jgi:hypothetical protein